MIRTHIIQCSLPKSDADALNRASGRIYSGVVVEHWRILRKSGHWLSSAAAEKLSDYYTRNHPPLLHAHSKDAAQQGFAKAANTIRAVRQAGIDGMDAHFPRKRKFYRTTVWKNTAIRLRNGLLLLSRARGLSPVSLALPAHLSHLSALPAKAFSEARLVWDQSSQHYEWHVVVEDGLPIPQGLGSGTIAVDMGEIHPAVCTDGATSVVISCKALRSLRQYTQKRGSVLRSLQDTKTRGSRAWRRLKKRGARFRAQQKRRIRDTEHKISREVVRFAEERKAGTIAIGDVRDIADKTDMGKHHNQRMSTWAHGRIRAYITYKAKYVGMRVVLIDEHHTTQSCPTCGHRTKPKGRAYTCLACGFRGHRDVVGAANILSRHLRGQLSKIAATEPMYRYPYLTGKRSRQGTAQVACTGQSSPSSASSPVQEALAS